LNIFTKRDTVNFCANEEADVGDTLQINGCGEPQAYELLINLCDLLANRQAPLAGGVSDLLIAPGCGARGVWIVRGRLGHDTGLLWCMGIGYVKTRVYPHFVPWLRIRLLSACGLEAPMAAMLDPLRQGTLHFLQQRVDSFQAHIALPLPQPHVTRHGSPANTEPCQEGAHDKQAPAY
jgi:hypothetical protein